MSRSHVAVGILATALFAASCATSGAEGVSSSMARAAARGAHVDENRITAAEIEAAGLPNAYELVSRLRRPWLRRDPLTGAAVVVYQDGRGIGGAEKLRDIPAVDIAELVFLPHEAAVRQWGAAVEGSAIVVVLRR
ncbi:MAG TPA: hypothetical protein VF212_17535 [Longimicrobiales bacterium]